MAQDRRNYVVTVAVRVVADSRSRESARRTAHRSVAAWTDALDVRTLDIRLATKGEARSVGLDRDPNS